MLHIILEREREEFLDTASRVGNLDTVHQLADEFIGLRPMNVRNIRTPKGCEFISAS